MRFNRLLALLLAVLLGPLAAVAQPTAPQGALSGSVSLTPGTTALRTDADRAADIGINVKDFGADNTGATDASSAINAAANAFRTFLAAGGSGTAHRLKIPPGEYLILSTVNFEFISSRGSVIDAQGATFFGQTNGQPVVSLIGSNWLNVLGLHVFGKSTLTPSIGIQIGRAATSSCSEGRWNNVVTEGQYTFTGVYIMGCESTSFASLMSRNTDTGGPGRFALVLDGTNHWGINPITAGKAGHAVDSFMGFHEVWMPQINLATLATDAASAPLWIEHMQGLRIEGYIAGGSQQNVIVYAGHTTGVDTDGLIDINWDIHTESQNGTLLYEFFITGLNTTPRLYQWDYRTSIENARTATYQLDSNIVSATLVGSTPIRTQATGGVMVVFNQPLLWTVSGHYELPSGSTSWNLPDSNFAGSGTRGLTERYIGDGSALTGIVASLPSNIAASSISNTGNVISVVPTGTPTRYNIDSWCFHTGTPCASQFAHLFPAVTISPPPAGGAQATAVVDTMTSATNTALDANFDGVNLRPSPGEGGSGYTVNDTLTMIGGNCSSAQRWRVVSVDGSGAITAFSVNGGQAGICSAIPNEPISTTGGTGTGLLIRGITWSINTIRVTNQGANYIGTPSVALQPINGFAGTAVATTDAATQVAAANGKIVMNGAGTTVGVTGSPIINIGVSVDATGIRQVLTSTFTVPASTSLVRFVQTGTLAAAVVTLPTIHLDGQAIQFINYAGTVTAFSFSPAVVGWTNGSQLNPNTGFRIRWDASSSAWVLEQSLPIQPDGVSLALVNGKFTTQGGLTAVGTVGNNMPDGVSAQAHTFDESRIYGAISTRAAPSCVQVEYANWIGSGGGELPANSTVVVSSALEINEVQNAATLGSAWQANNANLFKLRFTFGGQSTATLVSGARAISDPLCYPFKAGGSYYTDTWRQSLTPNVPMPTNHYLDNSVFETVKDGFFQGATLDTTGAVVATTTIDQVLSPTISSLPLRPGSVKISGTNLTGTLTDDGAGNFPAGNGLASPSPINYATGEINLNMTVATQPKNIFVSGQGFWNATIPDETGLTNPSGFQSWGQHNVYGPSAMLGTNSALSSAPFVMGTSGDSIDEGIGSSSASRSWVDYAVGGKFPTVKLAQPGAKLANCASMANLAKASSLLPGGQVDRMISNLGVNDVSALNLATMQANFGLCTSYLASLTRSGSAGIYWATILPDVVSASNNTPASVGGFGPGTVASGTPSIRNSWNAWLYTQIGTKIAGVIDTAACVENAPASQAGAGDGILTNLNLTFEGLHPSQLGHTTIGACVAANAAFN